MPHSKGRHRHCHEEWDAPHKQAGLFCFLTLNLLKVTSAVNTCKKMMWLLMMQNLAMRDTSSWRWWSPNPAPEPYSSVKAEHMLHKGRTNANPSPRNPDSSSWLRGRRWLHLQGGSSSTCVHLPCNSCLAQRCGQAREHAHGRAHERAHTHGHSPRGTHKQRPKYTLPTGQSSLYWFNG